MAKNRADKMEKRLYKSKTRETAIFEDILDIIGHFRRYQVWIYVLLSLPEFGCAMTIVFFIFGHANPGWRCHSYEENSTSIPSGANLSWITDNSQCEVNGTVCVEYEFREYYTSVVTEWNLVCGQSYVPHLAVTIQFVGVMVGIAIFGYLSDTYGRRWPGLLGNTLMMVAQTANGLAPTPHVYIVIRFVMGFFAGSVLAIYFVYRQEFTGPKWRMIMGNFGLFGAGHAFLNLLAYFIRDWRVLAYASGIIPLFQIPLTMIFVPESPRWLVQKDKFDEAEKVVRRIARNNGRPVPHMNIVRAVARARETDAKSQYSFIDLYTTPELRRRTLALAILWFTVGEIFYGVMLQVSSLSGDMYINSTIFALSAYPVCWLCVPIFNRISRRIALVVMLALTILLTLSIVIFSSTGLISKTSTVVTVVALAGKALASALWNLSLVYTVELYPTLIRNIGYSHGSAACRIGAMLAPQFALLGVLTHWITPYVIHTVLGILCAILAVAFLPDTNRKPLTESVTGRDLEEPQKDLVTGRDLLTGRDFLTGRDLEEPQKDLLTGRDLEEPQKDLVTGRDLEEPQKDHEDVLTISRTVEPSDSGSMNTRI